MGDNKRKHKLGLKMIESPNQVYEWVKTGHWSFAEFSQWITASRTVVDRAYNEGYNDGRKDEADMVYTGD
jgi:hypothetical protein